jgi:hypothetical protein
MTPKEQRILNCALLALRRTTEITASPRHAVAPGEHAADAIVEFETEGRKYRFRAEIRAVDRFATPAVIKAGSNALPEPPLLVAPYITREVAEHCRQLHLPFIDTAGNAWLAGPGLLVYVVGQPRPTSLLRDRFRAMNPAGLRIVFALLCNPDLIRSGYREIAMRAGVALGTVGPVVEDLKSRGFLGFQTERDRKLLDPAHMVEEWVTHYPIALRPRLNPRRFRADPGFLDHIDLRMYQAFWGGEPAAGKLTRYLKPAEFTIYVRAPIAKLVAAGRMRADENGNLEILDGFWNFETSKDFPDVVPPLLAYADLLATHEGRNAEAARIIYEERMAPTFASAQ